MKKNPSYHVAVPDFPRRRFVQGLALGGVVLGMSPWSSLLAAPDTFNIAPHLSGQEFDLTISEVPVNFTGNPRMATVVNGSVPGPTLHWREIGRAHV